MIAPKVSAIVVLCGIAVLIYAAFTLSEMAGLVALGASLIVVGAEDYLTRRQ